MSFIKTNQVEKRCYLTPLALFFFWLVFFALPLTGHSLDFAGKPRFQHYTTENGLVQNAVNCMLQDNKGLLWFGTQQGLNRFNGYEFETFRKEPGNPNSLNDEYILGLLQDDRGIIWIGTQGGGLERFDPALRRFTHFPVDTRRPDSPANNINCVLMGRSGKLWVGTAGGGVKRFDRKTGIYEDVALDRGRRENPGDLVINAIHEDRSGAVWIGRDSGLVVLQPASEDISRLTDKLDHPQDFGQLKILTFHEDRAGELWIGSNHGFYLYNRADDRFKHYHVPVNEDVYFSATNTIQVMYEDRLGVFWIGAVHGLHVFHRHEESFQSFFADRIDPNGLSDNSVESIYEDRSGALWFGLMGGGLEKLNRTSQSFKHYYSNPRDPSKISSYDVFAMHEDKDGWLWIGTYGDGLNVYHRPTGGLKNYRNIPGNPDSLSGDFVWAVYEDSKNRIWVGTDSTGLNRFSRDTGKFTHFRYRHRDPSSLSNDTISCVIEDHSGTIWIATNGGINKFNEDTGCFTRFQTGEDDKNSLAHNQVYVLLGDREGLIWAGTAGGLSALNPAAGTFISYPLATIQPGSLISHPVFSLCQDRHGMIWIGTTRGLIRLIPPTREYVVFGEKDGLPSDVINGILEDNRGNLWVSTNRGLSRFNPKTGTFNNYNRQDGLQSYEFNGGSYYKSTNGELFFGGINGFNAFFPEDIKDNPYVPPVVITGFKIFDRDVQVGEKIKGRKILDRSIMDTDRITLSYKHNGFSLEFAALNYIHSENNEYAYIMEGLEENWTYAWQRRFVTYANLSPGDYTFRVKASNNNGIWNEEGVSLGIRIVPPFWNTWWFRLSIVALILLMFFTFHVVNNRVIERRKKELEDIVAQRTIELRESGEKYQTVVETAQQGIAIIQDLKVVFLNARFADMLGLDEKKILQRPLDQWAVPSKQPALRDLMEQLSREPKAAGRTETKFLHSGGGEIQVEINYGAIRYKRGRALLLFFQDIGFKKVLEKERMKSARLESSRTLARGIAHDFNNLLAIIVGYIGLALEEVSPGSQVFKLLKEAGKTSNRAADLTRQFIFLARGGDPVKEVIPIASFIKTSVMNVLHDSPVKANFNIAKDLWPVDCDSDHIVQAIKNIVTNACQAMNEAMNEAMSEDGVLEIEATNKELDESHVLDQPPGKYVCITFKDNGTGISEEDLPHIFDPYFSTREEVTRKGLGLGLAVVHSIVSQHKGIIQVESQLEKGTLVRLCLPATPSKK